jgi:hypothetical protein
MSVTAESPLVTTFLQCFGTPVAAVVGGGIAAAPAGPSIPVVSGGVAFGAVAKMAYDAMTGETSVDLEDNYRRAKPEIKEQIRQQLLDTDEGRQALASKSRFAGVLSAADPASLKDIDLQAAFGKAKDDVLAEALRPIAQKTSAASWRSVPKRAAGSDSPALECRRRAMRRFLHCPASSRYAPHRHRRCARP